MKSIVNIGILCIAFAVAVVVYHQKNQNNNTQLDEIKTALAPLSGLKEKGTIIDCFVSANEPETMFWMINAMAPATLIPALKNRDTTLFVFKQDTSDSLINERLSNREKIWEARSGHYYFVIAKVRR